MYQKVTILENAPVCSGSLRMVLDASEIARASKPGQFVMLKAWEGLDPFLPRPFSIHSANRSMGRLELLYKVVGRGTEIMQELKPGDAITILGPLGHGFPLAEDSKRIALVGRGIGIAPLLFLAEEARRQGTQVHAYLSARDEDHLFAKERFIALGCHVDTTCESGALVTDFFAQELQKNCFDAAYACGSKRLMGEVRRLQKAYGFAGYVSLEEHMACGIGACKGCVCTVHDKDGSEHYDSVCKSGPVFPLERIVP
ncbi:MAG: dihydroorotate dehydrogenase electron transfer subunit [Clostridia bacterium]|nr:dihydroorotate dehydrogenase electron transfer subunit [Candidatus Pelethousia sp.]NCB30442.1 dihydroorotate dehydrogenase electron transfer subunit [Clostridia bacterium]